jgi:hypothetical protein
MRQIGTGKDATEGSRTRCLFMMSFVYICHKIKLRIWRREFDFPVLVYLPLMETGNSSNRSTHDPVRLLSVSTQHNTLHNSHSLDPFLLLKWMLETSQKKLLDLLIGYTFPLQFSG